MPTTKPCPACEKPLRLDAKFCNFCGTKVVIQTTPVSAPDDLLSLDKYRYRPAVTALTTHPDFEKGFATLKKKIPDIIEKLVDTQPSISGELLHKIWDDLSKDNIWLLVKYIDWAQKLKSKLPPEIIVVLEQNDDPLVQQHLKQYVCQK
jgi:hypothetical protein